VLIVIERESIEVSKQKSTLETSYYVSNSTLKHTSAEFLTQELAQATGMLT